MTPLGTKNDFLIMYLHSISVQNPPQMTSGEISFLWGVLDMDKICVDCRSTSTSQWYKKTSLDGTLSKDQCNKCYQAAKSALSQSGSLGRSCVDCQGVSTSQWYKKTSLGGISSQDQCNKCYQVVKRSLKRKENDILVSNLNKISKEGEL